MQTSAESEEIIWVSIFKVHHPTFKEAFIKYTLFHFGSYHGLQASHNNHTCNA